MKNNVDDDFDRDMWLLERLLRIEFVLLLIAVLGVVILLAKQVIA